MENLAVAELFDESSLLLAPTEATDFTTLHLDYTCVESKPVLKIGVPARVLRVQIPVSPLR
jgi:hypothetical protein